ncbi:MAG: hypothetical protein ACOCTS_02655 [Thermodesulfobacteriota bacterium]
MEAVGYDSLFAFAYSDRPNAPARRFPEKVAEEVKNRRLRDLFAAQEEITREKQEALVGRCLDVLVEGESKRQQKQACREADAPPELSGRSQANRVVNFSYRPHSGLDIRELKGQIIPIRIEKAFSNSLWGFPAATESACPQSKGGCANVA